MIRGQRAEPIPFVKLLAMVNFAEDVIMGKKVLLPYFVNKVTVLILGHLISKKVLEVGKFE